MGEPAKKLDSYHSEVPGYDPLCESEEPVKIHKGIEDHVKAVDSFYESFRHLTPPEQLIDEEWELECLILNEIQQYL